MVVNGSGVDLESFPFVEMDHAPEFTGVRGPRAGRIAPIRFLLIARLLWDKGIGEYVAAARKVKCKYPWAEFHLVGHFDPNPTGLNQQDVDAHGKTKA